MFSMWNNNKRMGRSTISKHLILVFNSIYKSIELQYIKLQTLNLILFLFLGSYGNILSRSKCSFG